MRSIKILPAVLADVEEAALWYDENGYEGLGDQFIEAFYSLLPHIQQHGEIYRIAYQGFRKVLIKPFSYTLFYGNNENTWVVSLVIHASRRPRLMKEILRTRLRTD